MADLGPDGGTTASAPRAFAVLTLAATIAIAVAGCSTAQPTQYRNDPAVDRLPAVTADGALTDALPASMRSHVVATGTSAGGGFAIALHDGHCAVAVQSTTGTTSTTSPTNTTGTDMVRARAPRSSDDPVSRPSVPAARKAIGPSTSVEASTSFAPVTLWCGTDGAAVSLRSSATFTTTGTVSTVDDTTGPVFVTSAPEK